MSTSVNVSELFAEYEPWLGLKKFSSFCSFPNSFSYGVFANIGSGAVPGQVPGQVSGQVLGQVLVGSGAVLGQQVPAGSGAVPGQVSGQVPGQVLVPGQVPNHGLREGTTGSGKVPGQFFEPRSEPQVPRSFRGRFRTTIRGRF